MMMDYEEDINLTKKMIITELPIAKLGRKVKREGQKEGNSREQL